MSRSGMRRSRVHRTLIAAVVLTLFAVDLKAQTPREHLYFISTVPSDKLDARFSCALYMVEGGQVKKVYDIVNQDAGIDFVDADFESRSVVVVFPPVKPFSLAVLKMESPALTYSVSLPISPDPLASGVVGRYFVDTPTRGFGLVQWFHTLGNRGPDVLMATSLFSSLRGSEVLPGNNVRYFRWTGWSGTAVGCGGGLFVRMGLDAKLRWAATNDSLELLCPQQLRSFNDKTFTLVVNNSQVAVLDPGELDAGSVHVMAKAKATWRRVAVPPDLVIRAFGEWIAGIVVEENRGNKRRSPGMEIRQKETLAATLSNGRRIVMNVENLFEQSAGYYPGELFAYNANTDKSYRIRTGQGDSEIVLAADSALYYRVNDILFRAPIDGSSIGKGVQVAQDPQIIQAHWAFIGPR